MIDVFNLSPAVDIRNKSKLIILSYATSENKVRESAARVYTILSLFQAVGLHYIDIVLLYVCLLCYIGYKHDYFHARYD